MFSLVELPTLLTVDHSPPHVLVMHRMIEVIHLCPYYVFLHTKQTEMNVERQYYWTVSQKARRITSFLPSHVAYVQQETISFTMIVRDRTRGVAQ